MPETPVGLSSGGEAEVDLSRAGGFFVVKWSDPRNGGPLVADGVKQVRGGGRVSLGVPPQDANEDWPAVIRK